MTNLRSALPPLLCFVLLACAASPPHDAESAGDDAIKIAQPDDDAGVAEPGAAPVSLSSNSEVNDSAEAVVPAQPSTPASPATPLAPATAKVEIVATPASTGTAPVPATPVAPVPTPAVVAARAAAPASDSGVELPVAAAATATVRGTLKLVPNRGVALVPGEVAEAFVYYLPRAGGTKAKPGRFEIETRDKRFAPATLIVPVGSTVKFPNRDVVLHNAFSVSSGNSFDLGIYGQGDSRNFAFTRPGLVLVHCNVHHSMQADILVVDTPYFARVNVDGTFALANVPVGSGSLYLWHPRGALQSRLVDVPTSKAYVTELIVTKPRVPPHLNKEGQTYRAARAAVASP